MIASKTSDELLVRTDQTTSRHIALECVDDVMVSEMLFDDGKGLRPFCPLAVRVDGIEKTQPFFIASGRHIIELLGEPFEGTEILLIGYGLSAVSTVVLGPVDAAVAAQVAAMPKDLEGHGQPPRSLLTGINGTMYLDLDTKFWHREVSGAWQQQP